MSSTADQLSQALTERTARVAVLGLGYAGLPLAEAFVQAGFHVLGYDIDAHKIQLLQQGRGYLGHFSSARVQMLRSTGRFEASGAETELASADVLILCVPTPLTAAREPDLTAVIAATNAVARSLRAGKLVVLESTTYPGTTRTVVRPILEAEGLRRGAISFWRLARSGKTLATASIRRAAFRASSAASIP